MLFAIVLLVLGILSFVKGRISVSKHKELRGGGMYVSATLFCLPLPLTFLVAFALDASNALTQQPVPVGGRTAAVLNLLCLWVPFLAGTVLAFVLARPAGDAEPSRAKGFDVLPPR